MTSFVRILLFVPPFLLFITSANAQFFGKIERLSDEITYQVSILPTVDWSPPQSITNNAQVTLRAPTGMATIENLQPITGNWDLISPIVGPDEAPDFTYYSFVLNAPLADANYVSGDELLLFSFQVNGDCVPFELFDNENDPFAPPNNLMVNIGNVFTVLAAGPGVNAYEDNSDFDEIFCLISPELDMFVTAEFPELPCFGDESDVLIEIIGGVEPYQIFWENLQTGDAGDAEVTEFEGSVNFENFTGGNYEFIITDSEGQQNDLNYIIKEPLPIEYELNLDAASCLGSEDGIAEIINLTGGTISGDYQYNWENSATNNTQIESNLNPGIYSVIVSDDNDCQIFTQFAIEANAILEVEMEIENTKCFGESSGNFELTGTGTNLPFSFEWNNQFQNGVGGTAQNLAAGIYFFTATDATGVCQHIDTLVIEEPEELSLNYALGDLSCDGITPASIIIESVENAVSPIYTSIDGANFIEKMEFSAEPEDYFTLFVKDANGCETSEEIYVPSNDPIFLEVEKEYALNLGDSIELKAFTNKENVNFEWLPATFLSCNDCPNPMAKPLESVTYRVIAKDTVGCEAEARTSILVDKNREIFFPNAISPNNDGENDVFTVYAKANVQKIKSLKIVNRWGGLVFKSASDFFPNNPNEGWNGTVQGQIADAGTYMYECEVEFDDGVIERYFGSVAVVK